MWVQRRLWRENTKQAQHWHQESLDMFRIIGDPWGRAKTLTSLAQESCALGASQQATQYALEAAALALKGQLFPVMLDLLVVLARILSQEAVHHWQSRCWVCHCTMLQVTTRRKTKHTSSSSCSLLTPLPMC